MSDFDYEGYTEKIAVLSRELLLAALDLPLGGESDKLVSFAIRFRELGGNLNDVREKPEHPHSGRK